MDLDPGSGHKRSFSTGWYHGFDAAKKGEPLSEFYATNNTWQSTGYREGYNFAMSGNSGMSRDEAKEVVWNEWKDKLAKMTILKQLVNLDDALKDFDRSALRATEAQAEAERQEILKRFPLEEWPHMPVEKYALGFPDSYCRWLEYITKNLGSMKGDYATNKFIYRRQDGSWYFDQKYNDERAAWENIRSAYVTMFENAQKENYREIDALFPSNKGSMIRTKSLYIYFPDKFLPIYSWGHLLHFVDVLNITQTEEMKNSSTLWLNQALAKLIHSDERFKGWTNWQITRFFYTYFDPRNAERIVKIAPGENARLWNDCLTGGYICVGWDELGDLKEYNGDWDSFFKRFNELYLDRYNRNASAVKKKAKEIWTLTQLKVGDIVVANDGISKILAVGRIAEGEYSWRPERSEYKHTLKMDWDISKTGEIPPQKAWGFVTLCEVLPKFYYEHILTLGPTIPIVETIVPVSSQLLKTFKEIAEALERKGQIILYGPPGTGKTFTARQFAIWWLLGPDRSDIGSILASDVRFKEESNSLSRSAPGSGEVAQLTFLTFHPSYTYEDFIEGFKPVIVSNNGGTNGVSPSLGLSLRLQNGIFKKVCLQAKANPNQRYLVLIDEINRANIAKVFGELITLLEKDKRDMEITLPQSGEAFAIPSNLYLIGTMNTADKSIKLLDAALRRRFAFKELMPEPALLENAVINELELDDFLEELNRRVARKEGREKQIGHSFLLDREGKAVAETEEFARRFRQEILPLLQEFCYDDYNSLAYYIGEGLVDSVAQTLKFEVLSEADKLVDALAASFKNSQSN